MLCATMTGRGGTRSPAVWCMQLGKCDPCRQGVGSKNLLLLFVSVLYCPYGSAFPLGVMLGLVLSKSFSR